MRPGLLLLSALLLWPGTTRAQGLLVPEDKTLPPLSVVQHQVRVTIDEQVAVTKVEQTFRNAADRPLEGTFIFPVPKGASVSEFAMWVDGKKLAGEMLPAEEARKTYTDIVRRTQDPALLEYAGNNLLRLRVFPIPPHGEQKVTLTYTSVAAQDAGAVQYVYPLKATAVGGLSLRAVIKSHHGVQSVYSPSHSIATKQESDRETIVTLAPMLHPSDKDFQLFYSLGARDVGLTALTYRPVSTEDGHFLMLLTPKFEKAKTAPVPRDVVLVLDTSGSMAGVKIQQAKKALNHCLNHLNEKDRFAVINFCSTVNKSRDHLVASSREQVDHALKWVDRLEATSGTNINDALQAALEMRSEDRERSFTIVFFTDGQPTEGVTDPEKIVKNVLDKNTAETRIFTFGVGDDVNAALLDQLADQTRAVSTFVRPNEDIEARASALYDKISHPVLTNLKLKVDDDVQLAEVYPPHLPDLFHGGQVVVMGRFGGHGKAKVTLTGNVGKEHKEFVYETTFAKKTDDTKAFVEQLWARRKVGYLLDQIRANGEKKELVDEVKTLAKKHGIATPYSSFLVAPDGSRMASNAGTQSDTGGFFAAADHHWQQTQPPMPTDRSTYGKPATPGPLADYDVPAATVQFGNQPGQGPVKIADNAAPRVNAAPSFVTPQAQWAGPGGTAGTAACAPRVARPSTPAAATLPTGKYCNPVPSAPPAPVATATPPTNELEMYTEGIVTAPSGGREVNHDRHYVPAYQHQQQVLAQSGRVGVELALQLKELRNQNQLDATAVKHVGGRNLRDVGGLWLDDAFDAKMTLIEVKAMSAAYFRILERRPEMAEVFQLGKRVVWVTPSGAALVIAEDGRDKLDDAEIDRLFVSKK